MARKPACEMSLRELASYVDHSVIKPEFNEDEVREQLHIGVKYGCKNVAVNPWMLPIAKEITAGTGVGIDMSLDFPFGFSDREGKWQMAEYLCKQGVTEMDTVINYGLLRSGRYEEVINVLAPTVQVCHDYGVPIKIILETDALNREQMLQGLECVIASGADFVKTSTGFYTGNPNPVGASPEVIAALIEHARGRIKVKGAACIRTQEHFFKLIDLGVDRMGIGYKSTPVVLAGAK